MQKVAVINPGSHPAPSHIAAALASDQRLLSYWTSAQLAPVEAARLGSRLEMTLKARTLPGGIPGHLVERRGVTLDLLATYWRRRKRRARELDALYRRNRVVARAAVQAAASRARRGDPVALLFSTSTHGGASRIASRVGIPYSLYTPLPYLPALTAMMDAEAKANPRWARFLVHRTGGGSESDPDAEFEVANASLVIANSRLTAESYFGVVDPRRVITEPLAVDLALLERFRAARVYQPHRGRRSPLRLLFAGQISQRKGLSYLFEALEQLSDRPVGLTVVGSDSLGMSTELTSAYPQVRAVFLGPVSQPRLWAEMLRHDALVLPSLAEGLANVILEALALGLPVVATDRSGAADLEVDGRAGMVIPHSDAAAIAAAIATLISDDGELLTSLRFGAVELSREHGDWADYGRRLALKLDRLW